MKNTVTLTRNGKSFEVDKISPFMNRVVKVNKAAPMGCSSGKCGVPKSAKVDLSKYQFTAGDRVEMLKDENAAQ